MGILSRREFLQCGAAGLATATLGTSASLSLEAADTAQPVGKKGIGKLIKTENDWKKIAALKAHWFYNWGSTFATGKPESLEYVPMIWSGSLKKVQTKVDALKEQKHQTLLGFNEPDKKDQANMTVEQALDAWPALMESGLRLGSPAAAHPDDEWMKEFMSKAKAKKYRVDFVCVHWYWQPKPADFIGKLRKTQKLYDLPIWITEFGVADWDAKPNQPNRFSEDDVAGFLNKVLPFLEKTSWIERYAWFPSSPDSAALGPSALFDKEGNLTKVGKAYASG